MDSRVEIIATRPFTYLEAAILDCQITASD